MLPATNHDDTHSSDQPAPAPAAPLGFSSVPASTPLPSLQPIESITHPVHGTEPAVPVLDEPVEAPARPVPTVPVVREDWVPLADDFLPAAPRSTSALSSLGVGTPKQGFLARLRRQRDDAPAVEDTPDEAVEFTDAAPAPKSNPVVPSTPDDRESYAFWSQDRAPRDFSDVMALPDLPLDGSSEA